MADDPAIVQFIDSEIGDDFIVSFFVPEPDGLRVGRSIILLRDRKWEFVVEEADKGIKVYDDDLPVKYEGEDIYLVRLHIDDTTAEIETTHHTCKLDLRRVDTSEIRAARKTLRKMNHDKRFKLTLA